MNWYKLNKFAIFQSVVNADDFKDINNPYHGVQESIYNTDEKHTISTMEEEMKNLSTLYNKFANILNSLPKREIEMSRQDIENKNYCKTMQSRIKERVSQLKRRVSMSTPRIPHDKGVLSRELV